MLSKIKLLPLLPFFFYAVAFYFPCKTFLTRAEVKERGLVKAAILDYVEGVYEGDTTRIYKSVHPSLKKRGTWYDDKNDKYSSFQEMDFQQLVNLTRTWNKDGKHANADSPKQINVYDVHNKIASAKLVAAWGTDYFHLAKIEDKWYIMNVLWQTADRS